MQAAAVCFPPNCRHSYLIRRQLRYFSEDGETCSNRMVWTILIGIISQVQFDSGKQHPGRHTACGKVILTVVRREWEGDTAHRLTSLGHTLSISLWKCSLIEQGDTSCNVTKLTIQSYHTVSNLHDYLYSTASGLAWNYSIILPLGRIPGVLVGHMVERGWAVNFLPAVKLCAGVTWLER